MCDNFSDLKREVEVLSSEFTGNEFLLYAMGLRLRTMDYQSLYEDCLVDGPDDKKIDFFYIDFDTGIATIAQSYQSQDWTKPEPPANKASDLNTAVNWLLESEIDEIHRPEIKAIAQQMRDGLSNGDIIRVNVLFIHNLNDSINVDRELGTVQRALLRILDKYSSPRGISPEGFVRQAGRNVVEEWRRAQHENISIHDDITLTSTILPQKLESPEWHSVIASIPADQLVRLRTKYGDALFSANLRDYLGSRQAARNINRQIEKTAQEEPSNFWVYNNGITLLTNSIGVEGYDVHLSGVAVINGAQTTGSLTEAASRGTLGDAQVFVRAIKCNDTSLVESVIRYNNTQNPIKPWELRVIDPIQRRIKEEFTQLGINYQLRRSISRRRGSDLHYDKLGPFLSAFYGDPIAAHKNKAELFENEGKYRRLFDDDTHIKNLLFIYRLGNAIAITKSNLRTKISGPSATDDDKAKYDYFRYGAFAFVLMHVNAEVIGLWLEPSDTRYKRRVTLIDKVLFDQEYSELILSKLTEAILSPVHIYLRERDAYQELKTQSGVDGTARHARAIIQQVHHMKPDTYNEFTDNLVIL